eukprot:scaffold3964_cov126-Isochrysis_galbana.AAC.9
MRSPRRRVAASHQEVHTSKTTRAAPWAVGRLRPSPSVPERDPAMWFDRDRVDGSDRSLLRASIAVNVLFLFLFITVGSRKPILSSQLIETTKGLSGADSSVSCGPDGCMCGGTKIGPQTAAPPPWFLTDLNSMYETSAMLAGKDVPLSNYHAKATLVVNVASS